MSTILNSTKQLNTTQIYTTGACQDCMDGHCCGYCWCCSHRRDDLVTPAQAQAITIAALLDACGDVGCDWLSSGGPPGKYIDLSQVCGGSGYYGRAN